MQAEFTPESLSTEFARQFRAACPDIEFSLGVDGNPQLAIPAQHPEVGGINVWFDGEEITVGVGEFYHLHFDCMKYGPGEQRERDPDGVRQAVEWVHAFVSDAIILEIYMTDGEYYGGATYRMKGEFNQVDAPSNAKLVTWSGPWPDHSSGAAS